MAEYQNREIGWDEEVERGESVDYVLLPPGDYDFIVETFERGRFDGSTNADGSVKTPACNKAILKLRINTESGTTLVTEGLLLFDKMQWKLAEFFLSIGEKEVDGKVRMNWTAVPGATGRATIEVTTDRNDSSKKYNHVKKYLPMGSKKFEPGRF